MTAPIPGNEERRKAIALFNAHVQLLEPWLASAKFQRLVPATVGTTSSARRYCSAHGRRPSFRPLLADHWPGTQPPAHYANLDF